VWRLDRAAPRAALGLLGLGAVLLFVVVGADAVVATRLRYQAAAWIAFVPPVGAGLAALPTRLGPLAGAAALAACLLHPGRALDWPPQQEAAFLDAVRPVVAARPVYAAGPRLGREVDVRLPWPFDLRYLDDAAAAGAPHRPPAPGARFLYYRGLACWSWSPEVPRRGLRPECAAAEAALDLAPVALTRLRAPPGPPYRYALGDDAPEIGFFAAVLPSRPR
jgi:hypothetical protein